MPAVFPDPADVREGVQFGPTTGVEFTGTLDLPAEDDVRYGVDYAEGTQTGNLVLPSTSNVTNGVDYGADGEFVGIGFTSEPGSEEPEPFLEL